MTGRSRSVSNARSRISRRSATPCSSTAATPATSCSASTTRSTRPGSSTRRSRPRARSTTSPTCSAAGCAPTVSRSGCSSKPSTSSSPRASATLYELSSGQYSLRSSAEDEFVVVDHRNADETRSVRTLSGGETFQASLALALALSDQLAELSAAGGAKLDAIFLDEGFGTLDADTLETVAGTIESLGTSGRMVGIVTHVPALAERVPVRFRVSRTERGAQVDAGGRMKFTVDPWDPGYGTGTESQLTTPRAGARRRGRSARRRQWAPRRPAVGHARARHGRVRRRRAADRRARVDRDLRHRRGARHLRLVRLGRGALQQHGAASRPSKSAAASSRPLPRIVDVVTRHGTFARVHGQGRRPPKRSCTRCTTA